MTTSTQQFEDLEQREFAAPKVTPSRTGPLRAFLAEADDFAAEEICDADDEPTGYIVRHPNSDEDVRMMNVEEFEKFQEALHAEGKILSLEIEIDGEIHRETTAGGKLDSLATGRPGREIYDLDAKTGRRALVDCQYYVEGRRCAPSVLSRGVVVELAHFDLMMGVSSLAPRWAGLLSGAEEVRLAIFEAEGRDHEGAVQCFVRVGEGPEALAAELDISDARELVGDIRERSQLSLTLSGDPRAVQSFEAALMQPEDLPAPAAMP
jgi:hypothetical protein